MYSYYHYNMIVMQIILIFGNGDTDYADATYDADDVARNDINIVNHHQQSSDAKLMMTPVANMTLTLSINIDQHHQHPSNTKIMML